jgi:outer membrane protein TolC
MAGIKLEEAVILQGSLLEYPELPATKNISEILASRSDYQALINEKILREINVEAKMAEFYPSLSASLTYGWQKSDDGCDLGEGTKVLSAGLNLTIPVFYGGSRFALLEEAKLELSKTNTTILKKEEDVQIQINNIFLTLKEARGRIDSADTTLKVAEKAYSLSETSVNNGLATQLDLKDASLNLEGAQLNYYIAIFDYLNAYFDWQQATGIGSALL